MHTHLHKLLSYIKDVGVLCKWVQESFNHREALSGFSWRSCFPALQFQSWLLSVSVYLPLSLSLSLSLSLPVCLSVSQSSCQTVWQSDCFTSGGECAQCQTFCNILKMREFKTASAECFADFSISAHLVRQLFVQAPTKTILFTRVRLHSCSIQYNVLYVQQL